MQNVAGAKDHILTHMTYPANKMQLVTACNASEFSEEDKKEFAEKLPDGTYNSSGDVMKALGWPMA